MSWKTFGLSAVGIVALLSAALLYVASGHVPLRKFIISNGPVPFYIMASEARIEGFCTVFFVGETRIAAVCGQHDWVEAE